MKRLNYNQELEIEKKKLIRLVGEALKSGTPIIEDEAVMKQNRKVDELIVRIQRDKLKYRKNQQER